MFLWNNLLVLCLPLLQHMFVSLIKLSTVLNKVFMLDTINLVKAYFNGDSLVPNLILSICSTHNSSITILSVYVDDIIITGNDSSFLDSLISRLNQHKRLK